VREQASLVAPEVGRAAARQPARRELLTSSDGPRLLDFETACRVPSSGIPRRWATMCWILPELDRELVATLRGVCVVAKCSVACERAPELREAARVHLKLLRGEPLR
jgi:hypothetical protein